MTSLKIYLQQSHRYQEFSHKDTSAQGTSYARRCTRPLVQRYKAKHALRQNSTKYFEFNFQFNIQYLCLFHCFVAFYYFYFLLFIFLYFQMLQNYLKYLTPLPQQDFVSQMQILCVFCISCVLDMQLIIVIGLQCFACPDEHLLAKCSL